ncbi:MAG: ketoacyl-ACP synthase III [Proteobacteria bacterium]|nr:ketoacyl-ACP synthase III [Pseudomonadota bacterium]
MAYLTYKNVGIKGLAAAVPANVIHNYDYAAYFKPEDVKDVVDKIGVKERRFADASTCASDLCFAAAERLISDMAIDRTEIDLLIMVSQTGDFKMPATSVILQDRLGLSKKTMAFDINLACSGFVYSLSVVYALMQQNGLRKALLVDGETRSKIYSPKDRKAAFLFGDGGVAALIERDEKFGNSYFSLNSDGSRESLIKINAGGYRNPSSAETRREKVVDEYGNIRSEEHGYMNGADVFTFLIREIPKDIKELLQFANTRMEAFDYYLFHQANSFMNNHLIKKLNLPFEKVPFSIEKFGNTSSVSIPLTIVSQLNKEFNTPKKLLLSAFGAGLSWATGIVTLDNCHISPLVEI